MANLASEATTTTPTVTGGMMSERDYIYAKDLPLYVDVYCNNCGKLCALSNTVEVEGRHLCRPCAGEFPRGAAVTEFLADYEPEVIRL